MLYVNLILTCNMYTVNPYFEHQGMDLFNSIWYADPSTFFFKF